MRRLAPLGLALFTACGSSVEPLDLPVGCQPLLAGTDCLLPYPSDFFRVADPTKPSGARVEISGAARMITTEGKSAIPHEHRPSDGFSRIPSLGFVFDVRVDPANLTRLRDDPASAKDTTAIIDSETGERIAHYADVDPDAEQDELQAIILHPRVGLRAEHRYVVAVHSLVDASGAPIAAPEGFRRLRDAEEGAPTIDGFEADVFGVTDRAGIARSQLQLAWSFTTGSEAFVKQDMLRVRDLTREWLASNTPTVEITKVAESATGRVWRQVQGTVTGPLFLVDDKPGAALVYDDQARVRQNGTVGFRFLATIPASVRDGVRPARIIGLGHGIFGDRREASTGASERMADELGAIVIAIDWWGMSMSDVFLVVDGLVSNPKDTLQFTDRVHQAMANWIVLFAALEGPMRMQDGFRDGATTLYEMPSKNFIGLSAGHILAGTLLALSPDIDRCILNVGGAGFTHLMSRSRPFAPFLTFLDTGLPAAVDRQKYFVLLQEQFDRIDPATYAPSVLQDKLPGAPADRRVLLQIGLGDVQVPNLASFLHARLLDIPLLTPAPTKIWGLEEVAAPHDGSAMALYDFGVDLSVYDEATPRLPANQVHDGLRGLDVAIEQMGAFFTPAGTIVQPCDGPCDPE